VRAFALMLHAHLAERRGDLDAQRGLVRAAHVLLTEIGDRFGLGMVLHSLGELEDLAGELDAAARAYDEAIALATELGNGDDLPQFLVQRARLDLRRGDPAAAHARLDEAFEQARDSAQAMSALHLTRFDAHRRTGDLDAARAALGLVGESLQRAWPGVVHAGGLAALALAETGPAAAAAPLVAAVTAAVESKDGPAVATIAELAARARLAAGDPSGAAQLLGVATTQRGTLDRGDPEVMAVLAAVRDALGPAAAELAVQWGRELPHADGLALLAELARGLSGGLG
jgi:tetratricopeptide (TPR) repeat protein